jgi:hypothetical protein
MIQVNFLIWKLQPVLAESSKYRAGFTVVGVPGQSKYEAPYSKYKLWHYSFSPLLISYKLHNEELHNLYSSPSIIRMMKSRRIRWSGHVVRIGAKRNTNRILVRKPE